MRQSESKYLIQLLSAYSRKSAELRLRVGRTEAERQSLLEEWKANRRKFEDTFTILSKAGIKVQQDLHQGGWRLEDGKMYKYSYFCYTRIWEGNVSLRHSVPLKVVNMNPDGKLTGDCTTRAMTYCTKDSYTVIQAEQRANARGHYYSWNSDPAWHPVFQKRGFVRVCLRHYKTRAWLANALREFKFPMACTSSGHIACIDSGAVVDTWDSRGGRCDDIFIPQDHKEEVCRVLAREGLY